MKDNKVELIKSIASKLDNIDRNLKIIHSEDVSHLSVNVNLKNKVGDIFGSSINNNFISLNFISNKECFDMVEKMLIQEKRILEKELEEI